MKDILYNFFLFFEDKNINNYSQDVEDHNINDNKNKPPFSYVKYTIMDHHNNRNKKKVSKKRKGLYIFEILKYNYI